MIDPELSQLPYRPPPMTRGVDPKRMNWLWRLICELSEVTPEEVVGALHEGVVPVSLPRVKSWIVSDRHPAFFPISMGELERNVRALIELRKLHGRPQPSTSEQSDGTTLAGIDPG